MNLPLFESADSLFIKGEYVNAVFEAAKSFIEAVKHQAGNPVDKNGKPLDGVVLIDNIFHRTSSKTPTLKFNALASLADQNEHDGLYYVARGMIMWREASRKLSEIPRAICQKPLLR
ncbi:MAG TPA: TIGR02391 family protein [Blastocatellia bacterium]|nr:TIGR02391 family protein [Blastocatellia bacterium]